MAVALVALAPAVAFGQSPPPVELTAGQIGRLLDRPAPPLLLANETPLTEVVARLAGPGGRWLDLPDNTLSYLPYGELTTVAVRLPAMKLRDQLVQLLAPLSLTFRVVDGADGNATLRIEPRPELVRVGRRASIDEIGVLYVVRTLRVSTLNVPLDKQIEQELRQPVSFHFDLAGLDATAARKRLDESLARMEPDTVAGLLDGFCAQGPWTWRVDEHVIWLLDKPKQVLHQLRRQVSVRWNQQPIELALMELGGDAGVLVQFQPGLIDSLDAANQRVSWQAPDKGIVQIIEALAARTGLAYEIRDESIYLFSPALQRNGREKVLGLLEVPTGHGGVCRILLRESMLPEDVRGAFDQHVQQAIDELVKQLRADKPAAPPAP